MVGGVDIPCLCSVHGRGCGHALPMRCVWQGVWTCLTYAVCMVGGVDMPGLCSVYGRECGHAWSMQCVW